MTKAKQTNKRKTNEQFLFIPRLNPAEAPNLMNHAAGSKLPDIS